MSDSRPFGQFAGDARGLDHLARARGLQKQGNLKKAEALYRKALRTDPDNVDVLFSLGSLSLQSSKLELAEKCLTRVLELRPRLAEAAANLGIVYVGRRRYASAVDACRRAVDLGLRNPRLYNVMGFALHNLGRYAEATGAYERVLSGNPNDKGAYRGLAKTLMTQGRVHAAVDVYGRLVAIDTRDAPILSALLMVLNYRPDVPDCEILDEHRRLARHIGLSTKQPVVQCGNGTTLNCPLRIGYISPDFRTHSVASFFESLLAEHDRAQVKVFCYADVRGSDETTARIRRLAHRWRDTLAMSHEEVVRLVRKDGIDILVDLAGHTADNRLPVFARKPAPVQVTYLGYPNTTGLSTIDYRLTDGQSDPAGEEAYHTERLVRLGRCFVAYRPPAEAPAVVGPPGVESGRVTFGSFNNIAKVNEEVIALWSRVLAAVADSRLLLKSKAFDDPPTAERFRALFARHGIGAERLELRGYAASQMGHLGLYAEVDIALDTFPYNGTTTTCEALWMGVPVVTLAGERHRSRVGLSLLRAAGLAELVAESADQYVAHAVALAGDGARLVALRSELRDRLQGSELLDGAGLARAVEAAYRQMWAEACAGTSPAGGTPGARRDA